MTPEQIAAMQAENARLKQEADDRKKKDDDAAAAAAAKKTEAGGGKGGEGGDDPDLREKARLEREAGEKKKGETKQLESAVSFNMSLEGFLKGNADVLPSTMAELVKQADKEKYDSVVERANVVKAALVQEFFSVQANLDLLTAAQKAALSDYLKLTKMGKEQKADGIYENIFEPALETLKKVKKAEEVGKAHAGLSLVTGSGEAFIKKISKLSEEFYLGKKEAA